MRDSEGDFQRRSNSIYIIYKMFLKVGYFLKPQVVPIIFNNLSKNFCIKIRIVSAWSILKFSGFFNLAWNIKTFVDVLAHKCVKNNFFDLGLLLL